MDDDVELTVAQPGGSVGGAAEGQAVVVEQVPQLTHGSHSAATSPV